MLVTAVSNWGFAKEKDMHMHMIFSQVHGWRLRVIVQIHVLLAYTKR